MASAVKGGGPGTSTSNKITTTFKPTFGKGKMAKRGKSGRSKGSGR